MSNTRIKYIDMLKAVCIILVILGHMSYTPSQVKLLLYIFHIPLFFFLSGMTLNISKYNSFFEFTKKKIQTIIIPCFLMNISIFLIQSIVFEPQNILKMDIVHFIKALVIADRLHVYFQLWFLYALFLAELVCYVIIKYKRNNYGLMLSYVLLIVLGLLGKEMYINEYWLVWSFDLVPFAAIFILTGYIVRVNMDMISKWFSLLYFIPVAALSLASGIYNKRVDLFYQQTNSIPLYFIAAFCGIWASIILFKNLPSISIFEKIGRNTLIYYAYHSPIVLYILDIIMGQLAIRYTGIFVNNYIITCVELVLAICFCEVIAKIINNSFPFLLGKKTNKKVA